MNIPRSKNRLLLLMAAVFVFASLMAHSIYNFVGSNTGAKMVQVGGKALIGGPFRLIDHTGKRVTAKDFRGRFMLVFFGFTSCPDVCPTELQVMTAALQQLGKKADKVTPVFITIDPERDTVEQMASYVSNFHERIVGLTGSSEEIRAVAKAYRIFYARAKDDASSTDYLMEHSSIVYLMSPNGEYLKHFSYGTSPEKMAVEIAKFL